MVLRTEPDGAAIGFKDGETGRIPFSQMRWARPLHDDGDLGPFPRSAADVVKPGDLVLVEPLAAESAKPGTAPGGTAPGTTPGATPVAAARPPVAGSWR
jgi:membrane carboxypeptidase/penicillin-binding protein